MGFLKFVAMLGEELFDLFQYAQRGQPDAEEEDRLAKRIIRKASDEQMRKELAG